MGCFLGNTCYNQNFSGGEGPIHRPYPFLPQGEVNAPKKFRGLSCYKEIFASDMHNEQASGAYLGKTTAEQQKRTQELGNYQRRGNLQGDGKDKLQGKTAQ